MRSAADGNSIRLRGAARTVGTGNAVGTDGNGMTALCFAAGTDGSIVTGEQRIFVTEFVGIGTNRNVAMRLGVAGK